MWLKCIKPQKNFIKWLYFNKDQTTFSFYLANVSNIMNSLKNYNESLKKKLMLKVKAKTKVL